MPYRGLAPNFHGPITPGTRFGLKNQWGKAPLMSQRQKVKSARTGACALRRMLDAHRTRCGNPTTGPMFATMDGRKAVRASNLVNRQILPVLNACHCGKTAGDHAKADHKFERNTSLPQWHGWHPFRRGLAANLHDLGIDDKTIQRRGRAPRAACWSLIL
jgi:hypothetical protein